MAIKVCPNCKEVNPGNVLFCAVCGTNLRVTHATMSKAPIDTGIFDDIKKDDMKKDPRRWGIGMIFMRVLSILLKPLIELLGDDGSLGRFFSNTQNPPS